MSTIITGLGVGRSDEWYTPAKVFDALGEWFDLDVAHPPFPTNSPCTQFYSDGSLEKPWGSGFVWMNPPFGGPNGLKPWLLKFFDHGNGVALTPDRTSAGWFHDACRRADLMLFVSPRLQFEKADGRPEKSSNAGGTTLWASGSRACSALERAAASGLGVLVIPIGSTSRG